VGFEAVNKPEIILVGAGGHCRSCIDVIELEGKFSIAGIVDRPGVVTDDKILGYPVLGTDDDLTKLRDQFEHALVTVGQIRTAAVRIKLYDMLISFGFQLPVIQSPLAYVSKHAHVGKGTIVMHQAIVNAGARIGCNGILNTKALIEHNAFIDDHCHVSTGAIVNGGASIGKGSFIGSQSCVVQSAVVDENCFAKALSLITENFSCPEKKK
jgi:sugar O-acyltransferase (sialic acid O-acetyltransferase NeuD family)